ncbi:hypothetical protein C1631_000665 [Chryseobacterium phosphatilyticum]|uniref:Uncharacterized protein n=1 Tax=Chryseobacterium phosphatilyticum TaxID=475075 RepID=A0A316XBV1_9FLAO|nr:hypothetical protein [Chryseobacterium phosphatilyticum]PWN71167.1 hypothetical protein C1631_000665 [Chryseobacterium phosphatilyticum]
MFDLDYTLIKQEIESEICKEHDLHPEFVKTDEGFGIKACCDPFRIELVQKSEKMIEEQTEKLLDKIMKDMFKE